MPEPPHLIDPRTLLPIADAQMILRLRLLIARAANKDGLNWWDDEALTPAAQFILDRTFPIAPPLAARSLALQAAFNRHEAACDYDPDVFHLYRLDSDNLDRLVLEFWPLLEIPFPEAPITNIAELRQQLESLTKTAMTYDIISRGSNGAVAIRLHRPASDVSLLVHRAQTLAWAYLEGNVGQPCLPYCRE